MNEAGEPMRMVPAEHVEGLFKMLIEHYEARIDARLEALEDRQNQLKAERFRQRRLLYLDAAKALREVGDIGGAIDQIRELVACGDMTVKHARIATELLWAISKGGMSLGEYVESEDVAAWLREKGIEPPPEVPGAA